MDYSSYVVVEIAEAPSLTPSPKHRYDSRTYSGHVSDSRVVVCSGSELFRTVKTSCASCQEITSIVASKSKEKSLQIDVFNTMFKSANLLARDTNVKGKKIKVDHSKSTKSNGVETSSNRASVATSSFGKYSH